LCHSCVERYPWQGDAEVQQAIELRQAHIAGELSLARCLLVPSETHRQFLSRLLGISLGHLRVLPHGSIIHLSPHPDNKQPPRFPHRPLRLAYWGYLVHHKGVHLLLEAVRQLKDPSAVEVYLAGLAPDAQYFAYLQELAEGLSVTFEGEYQPADLAHLDVDMAVFPSLAYESYGFVLDEALQLGLPVIVSDRGALAARVGEAGLAFSTGDSSALAHRIQQVLDTPSLLEHMRQRLPSFPSPSMLEHVQALEAVYWQAMRLPAQKPASVFLPGPRQLAHLQTLLAARDQEILRLRTDLQQQGAVLGSREAVIVQQEGELRRQEEEIAQRNAKLQEVERSLRALEVWSQKIGHSVGWKVLQHFYRVRERLMAPPGTGRDRLYQLAKGLVSTWLEGGLGAMGRKLWQGDLLELKAPDPYRLWLARHRPTLLEVQRRKRELSTFAYQPWVSIVMPVYNTEEIWLGKALESVHRQIYPNWELCVCDDGSSNPRVQEVIKAWQKKDSRIKAYFSLQNKGIAAASNHALDLATGEFVGFLDHDDELSPEAIFAVVRLLNTNPALDLLYTDEDKIDLGGQRMEPFFKPDWSPHLFLSMNYLSHFTVIRRKLITQVGGFRAGFEGSQDYDLFLRVVEKTNSIGHIPRPVYSWRKTPLSTSSSRVGVKPYAHETGKKALQEALQRRQAEGEVVDTENGAPCRYRVRYRIRGEPRVSIIIPTKDKLDLLRRCLQSIEEKTRYRNYEILVIDNQSEKPETLEFLSALPYKVLRFLEPFNYSRINNFGVRYAAGEYLLFLNNDTQIITDEWLTALLELAQHPEVGAVGAKLLYPDGTIQHAGEILGPGGVAAHAFWYLPGDCPGYFDFANVMRNCSAVTAACMMMRKSIFAEVGGFDENITVAFNDVDLCLRVREKGYLIVYTPYARAYHHESATRGRSHPLSDEEYFRKRWGQVIDRGDPYYSPHLTLERFDFSLKTS
jgi:GT2 family glycosyltransferase